MAVPLPPSQDLLVFSDDFGRAPSAPQHLLARLAGDRRVLWVEPAGLRAPRPSRADLRRSVQKLRGALAGPSGEPWLATPPGLVRHVPPVAPGYGHRLVRAANDALLVRSVRRALAARGMERPLLITTIPTMAGAVGQLGEVASVYLRMDDFTLWPGYDHAAIAEREALLLERADLLVAPSPALLEVPARRRHLLPHGVDAAHFATGGEDPFGDLPRPRVLVSGRIDARYDADLLRALDDPRWTLVLLGDLRTPAPPRAVRFPSVPYGELPRWLHGADVLVAPYAGTPLGHSLAPLKLRELLATGRPVITTSVRGVIEDPELADRVTLADTPEALRGAVAAALADPTPALPLPASADWEARAAALGDLLATLLPSDPL